MSHDIETMMSARGQKPWHFGQTGKTGQTVVVDHAPTAAEAIRLAQLDWQVEARPVYIKTADDTFRAIENRRALTRDSDETVFATVSDKYVPLQNVDAFGLLDGLVDDGLKFETAGAIRGGRTVFVTAQLPEEILIGGEDAHQLFLFVTNDHRGLDAVRVGVTPVRIVCQNTLNLAMRNLKRSWSAPHVSTMEGKLQDAREALSLTWKYVDAFQDEAEKMLATKMSNADFADFLEKCLDHPQLGKKPRADAEIGITRLWNEAMTVENIRGTYWGALNAVSEYFEWIRGSKTPEARLINTMEGLTLKMRDRANTLLAVA